MMPVRTYPWGGGGGEEQPRRQQWAQQTQQAFFNQHGQRVHMHFR